VVSAEPYRGDLLARPSQTPVSHAVADGLGVVDVRLVSGHHASAADGEPSVASRIFAIMATPIARSGFEEQIPALPRLP